MIILKKEKNTYDKFIISKDGEEAKEFHKGALVRRKIFWLIIICLMSGRNFSFSRALNN